MKKPENPDHSSEDLHCFTCGINARWIKLLQSVPEFPGTGDTLADLCRQKNAFLRARAILQELDQFPVYFHRKKELTRCIHLLKQRMDAFPEYYHHIILSHVHRLNRSSNLQLQLYHVLFRRSKLGIPCFRTQNILLESMRRAKEQFEQLTSISLESVSDIQAAVALFNRNVARINGLPGVKQQIKLITTHVEPTSS